MIALLLQRKWQRHFGTRFRLKNRPSDETADNWLDRRTPKLAWSEPTTKPIQPLRQTILYVPLPGFGCLRGVFAARGCCNLLHFVHKLLHSSGGGEQSYRLFTKCSQTVAHCQKSCE